MIRALVLVAVLFVAGGAWAQGGVGASITGNLIPTQFSCFKEGISATTVCQAATSLPSTAYRYYITSINCSNEAATVQGVDVITGTGSTCGTNTVTLTHKFQMGTNATTTSPFVITAVFNNGIPASTNADICLRPTAATAFGCTISGFYAP